MGALDLSPDAGPDAVPDAWARGIDYSAMALPEKLTDWRLALAYHAATDAGLIGALPGTAAELAERCGLSESAVQAVLAVLVAWQLVSVDEHGRYQEGPAHPAPADQAMLAQHGVWIRRWAVLLPKRLHDRAATSPENPPAPAPGVGLDLLAAITRRVTTPVLDACLDRFPHARTVLDLGGGHGEYALALASRGLTTTMQDLPGVIEGARQRGRLAAAGVELFAGDCLETLPPGPFDLVLCSMVTNIFDAEASRDLCRRLRPIIAPGGGLAIVSYLRDRHRVGASFGLQMLVATPGGDAHGEHDYRRWLDEAGFGPAHCYDLDEPPQTVVLAGVPT
ncbi:methyltransferase domain-containing protein [Natronosporangium hydrolyticum]|uniref:Methyltransferase domain-containing protein n=1 Tax=Natronosporangium hydrolyticum TaxID=2811111 RepID=A0A895Y9H3_9ACTN|nr:methyltransferase [Natronosporangium hydrolyticum]QSB13971.1 methyltransferase domain-containing protein [Natronosporangium hydrolyticum]